MYKAELKTKYKDLVRQGKKSEASKVLDKLRNFSDLAEKPKKKVSKKKKRKKTKKKSKKKESLDNLIKINGIGKKTLDDIKRIYPTISKLKKALKKDLVPLDDNLVNKLNKELNK